MSRADGGSSYRNSASTGSTSADSAIDDAWQRVLQAFDDDKRHDAFISFARAQGGLHIAAGKYRELQEDPERGQRAKAKLKAVSFLATHDLMSSRTVPIDPRRRWLWLIGAAGLVGILMCAMILFASR